ncbi:MAG: hypothetical protein H0W50_04920 [Parachlamydiaceae bacterium]|nr:hypothetical protein [Parachlamydiaceae bacterium]
MNSVQTVKLTHLSQMHALPLGVKPLPEIVEAIVNSQIKVANYITKHPEAFVFLEGLTENWTGVPTDLMTHVVTKVIFPKGLPEDVAKLNSLQKDFLSNIDGEGSVRILNRFGALKSMYRTISPEENKIIHSKIVEAKTFEDALIHINEPRERAAMESIKAVLKDNPHIKEVILVFGGGHDFSRFCNEFGFEHEKVNCH